MGATLGVFVLLIPVLIGIGMFIDGKKIEGCPDGNLIWHSIYCTSTCSNSNFICTFLINILF